MIDRDVEASMHDEANNKHKPPQKKRNRYKPGKGPGRGNNNPNLVEDGKPYQWKPGQSGNPSGRPKNYFSPTQQIRNNFNLPANTLKPAIVRAKELGIDPDTCTLGDVFALSVMSDALGGKDNIVKEVLNRTDGRNPEVILSGGIEGVVSSLEAISDDQVNAMIRREVKQNGNTSNQPRRRTKPVKKSTSRRISKKKSG